MPLIVNYSTMNCESFYRTGVQPMSVVPNKPQRRWLMLENVYKPDTQPQWARTAAESEFVRIPMFSYDIKPGHASPLLAIGFQLAAWVSSSLTEMCLQNPHWPSLNDMTAHMVLGGEFQPSEDVVQVWVGLALMCN